MLDPAQITALALVAVVWLALLAAGAYIVQQRHTRAVQEKNAVLLLAPLLFGLVAFYGFFCLAVLPEFNWLCHLVLVHGIGPPGLVACVVVRMHRLHQALLKQHTRPTWPAPMQLCATLCITAWVFPLRLALSGVQRDGQCGPAVLSEWVSVVYAPALVPLFICGWIYSRRLERVKLSARDARRSRLALRFFAVCYIVFAPIYAMWQSDSVLFALAPRMRGDPQGVQQLRQAFGIFTMFLVTSSTCVGFLLFAQPVLRHLLRHRTQQPEPAGTVQRLDKAPALKPCDISSLLAEPKLNSLFFQYVDKRFAANSLRFVYAVQQRNACTCMLDRQSRTLDILNTFIRQGAERQINLSAADREAILRCNIADPSMFDRAINEMLHLLSVNFLEDFFRSPELMQEIARQHELQQQLERLHAAGFRVQPGTFDGTSSSPQRTPRDSNVDSLATSPWLPPNTLPDPSLLVTSTLSPLSPTLSPRRDSGNRADARRASSRRASSRRDSSAGSRRSSSIVTSPTRVQRDTAAYEARRLSMGLTSPPPRRESNILTSPLSPLRSSAPPPSTSSAAAPVSAAVPASSRAPIFP